MSKLAIIILAPGTTHPGLNGKRGGRFVIVHADDHEVIRAHFTSLEEAEAMCAAFDPSWPKKPRTAALQAEMQEAWAKWEADFAEWESTN
jgi:hypothetical protein